ncbi:MAG TPA: class I SAM-dependent methyltransferase [Nitrososphaerales archaeon]|nr:class I SAM-dependent methyltransferase [Nitrososphaerales archaeon]
MGRRALYSQLGKYYDRIYWWKDYDQEVDFLVKVFRKYGIQGRRVLEVACGTGNHSKVLVERGYEVTGVDVSDQMLRIARSKVKGRAKFVQGDMRDLDLAVDGKYDAAICLFSSISYNLTIRDLKRTIQGLYNHLGEPGVVVFDTHFTKKGFIDGHRGEDIFDDGRVIGARLGVSKREGDVGQVSFSYLVKDGPKTIVLRNDVHRLGLFDHEDFLRTMREVGFVETGAYLEWTFKKAKEENQFRDVVFAGRKLGTSSI